MNLTRINIVLVVLLIMTSLLAVSLKVDYSQPNVEFLPNMVHTPASKAYAANSVLANGRTLQAPVAGTIPRGDILPLYYQATKEDAARAGRELKNPFALDAPIKLKEKPAEEKTDAAKKKPPAKKMTPEELAEAARLKTILATQLRLDSSIVRGTETYNVFCISCHGPSGAGDGLVTKRGFPPPPPLTTGKSTEMQDGQLFHILTYGQGSMAPMVSQLSRNRRWDVINYIRTMQKGKKPADSPAVSEEKKPVTDPKAGTNPAPKATTPDPKTVKPPATGKTPQAEEK